MFLVFLFNGIFNGIFIYLAQFHNLFRLEYYKEMYVGSEFV